MNEMLHTSKRADATPSLLRVETDHVDAGIELLALHRALELRLILAVNRDGSRLGVPLPTIEAHDLMSLFQQQSHGASANVPSATEDTNLHKTATIVEPAAARDTLLRDVQFRDGN